MRTTIELRDDQRARLLELAARRGEKGFSGLIQEAVDRFLAGEGTDSLIDDALSVLGSLPREEADAMRARATSLRSGWRTEGGQP
jgi:hypothetical protein